mgnify:FL=1
MKPRVRVRRLKDGSVVATGSLVFKWQRKGVGKIERATGLPNTPRGLKKLERIAGAAEKLWERGRGDVLRMVQVGKVHPQALLEADRLDKLNLLPTPEYLLPLAEELGAWADRTANRHTRRNRQSVVRAILAHAPAGVVGELPGIVAALLEAKRDTPAAANRIKEQVLAYLRDRHGMDHPLHAKVGALRSLTTAPKYKRPHLTPAEFHAVLPKLGPAAEAFRLLCLSGMGVKEAWEDGWERTADGLGLAIHGKKPRYRERVVPWLAEVAPPTVSPDVLIWWLGKVGLSPYVGRRSLSRWMIDAGIPEWRVGAYMGHGAQSQTQVYQRGDVGPYLLGDAVLLRDHIGLPAVAAKLERTA